MKKNNPSKSLFRAGAGVMITSAFLLSATALSADERRGPPGIREGGPGGPGGMMRMLEASDANGDGTVTFTEVNALRAEMFAYLDRNADGVLDIQDRSPIAQRLHAQGDTERRHGPGLHRGPEGAEAAGERSLTREAFLAMGNPILEQFDTNGDEAITPDEFDAALEARESRRYFWRD